MLDEAECTVVCGGVAGLVGNMVGAWRALLQSRQQPERGRLVVYSRGQASGEFHMRSQAHGDRLGWLHSSEGVRPPRVPARNSLWSMPRVLIQRC
jgi:hypothetical protein